MLAKALFSLTLVGAEWVLYFLIGLSMVSLAIMVERGILFATTRADHRRLGDQLRRLLGAGETGAALSLLGASAAPAARVCLSGLRDADKGIGAVEENVAAAVNIERARFERNLAFLGTIGANAPFIGLFGTVLGIIKAFHDLALGSQEGASVVMAGISEALVATAVGLLVAIPAVMAFNLFKRQVAERMANADTLARVVFAHLKSCPAGAAQSK